MIYRKYLFKAKATKTDIRYAPINKGFNKDQGVIICTSFYFF